jgi:hypothetical protein
MTDNVVRVVIGQTLVGGSSVWGGITGDLDDQTDLQEALDGKANSAQGALADSAVQPGDLATVATTGDYDDLSGTPDLSTYVESDPTGVTGADAITNIMSLTQAEYDAIGAPDAATLYVITS